MIYHPGFVICFLFVVIVGLMLFILNLMFTIEEQEEEIVRLQDEILNINIDNEKLK